VAAAATAVRLLALLLQLLRSLQILLLLLLLPFAALLMPVIRDCKRRTTACACDNGAVGGCLGAL
jgi:hypothetical protein